MLINLFEFALNLVLESIIRQFFSLELSVLGLLSLLLAVELEVEDDDPLVELDELDEASLDFLDSDDDEDDSLLSLESLVSLESFGIFGIFVT